MVEGEPPGAYLCEIRAKGPKDMEQGPVGSFFRNYTAFYVAVKNHCAECPKCPPDGMLRALRRLRETRNGGVGSAGLVDMALSAERLVRAKGVHPPLDPDLIGWFIAASGRVDRLAREEARFPTTEALEGALRIAWATWRTLEWKGLSMHRPNFSAAQMLWIREDHRESLTARGTAILWAVRAMAADFDRGVRDFPERDWLELARVAEVMCG